MRVKTRSNLTGVNEPSFVIDTHKECTDTDTLAPRIGIADNHELLLIFAFESQPLFRPLMDIDAVCPLRNESFPALTACLLKIRLTIRLPMFTEPQGIFEGQRSAEQFFSMP